MLRQIERVNSIDERYQCIEELGGGTYGRVTKRIDRVTNEVVALKQILNHRDELDISKTTIFETLLMQELKHDNIANLICVVHDLKTNSVFLVMEYCEYDVYALLKHPNFRETNPLHVKSIMKQLLVALDLLGTHRIIHRDLKPANMFLTRKNIMKLGDFGLARHLAKGPLSKQMITLWYRPPEILLGSSSYGPEVDIWSAGCIFYEIVAGKPLFVAKRDDCILQLEAIFEICGFPSAQTWPDVATYENYQLFRDRPQRPSNLEKFINYNLPKTLGNEDFSKLKDLIIKMLQLNPHERITAERALNHPFFTDAGKALDPDQLGPIDIEDTHQIKFVIEKKSKPATVSKPPTPNQITTSTN